MIILFYCFGYSSQEKVEDISTIIHFFKYVGYSSQEKVEDVSAIIILFSNALCTQVKRRRVSYHHTCSIALGTQVKRKWRTPQLVPYFFYCFGCSGREKMQGVSLILIVSNTFCLFKSKERG